MTTLAEQYLRIKTPSWTVLVVSATLLGLFGFFIMSKVNIPKWEAVIITVMAYLMFSTAFFEKQKDGKIQRSMKNAGLMINSFALGLSIGCVVFGHSICWIIFSLVFIAITICSIVSLFFVTESVPD